MSKIIVKKERVAAATGYGAVHHLNVLSVLFILIRHQFVHQVVVEALLGERLRAGRQKHNADGEVVRVDALTKQKLLLVQCQTVWAYLDQQVGVRAVHRQLHCCIVNEYDRWIWPFLLL